MGNDFEDLKGERPSLFELLARAVEYVLNVKSFGAALLGSSCGAECRNGG
jgi:hypothetical protein